MIELLFKDITFFSFLFIVFAATGLGFEVAFTALGDLIRKKKRDVYLFGHSSLYYIPLYGAAVPFLYLILLPLIDAWPWFIRGLIYTPLFHAGEAGGMYLLRIINGASPTEKGYRASGRSLAGLTRLDYAPAMFIASLIFERLFIALTDYPPTS